MKLIEYLQDTRQELTKVTWPKRNKVLTLVVVVFIICLIVLGYVFIADSVISFLFRSLGRLI